MVALKHKFHLSSGTEVSLTTDEISELREILGSNVYISNDGYPSSHEDPYEISEEQIYQALMSAALTPKHLS